MPLIQFLPGLFLAMSVSTTVLAQTADTAAERARLGNERARIEAERRAAEAEGQLAGQPVAPSQPVESEAPPSPAATSAVVAEEPPVAASSAASSTASQVVTESRPEPPASPPAPLSAQHPGTVPASSAEVSTALQQLRELGSLKDAGYVTDEEFERIKQRILDSQF